MRLFVILVCLGIGGVAKAIPGKGDTTFIKRPYYLGVAVGYIDYSNDATLGTPFPLGTTLSESAEFSKFYSARTIGLVFAFPFLRKWECESGVDFGGSTNWEQENIIHQVPNTNPPVTWASSTSRWNNDKVLRVRSSFAYEVVKMEKVNVQGGIGGWYDGHGSSGYVGAEIGLKAYYPLSKSLAVQLGVNYGITKGGRYAGVRLALLLSGTRMYRVRPDSYYVRTYED